MDIRKQLDDLKTVIRKQEQDGPEQVGQVEERNGYGRVFNEGGKTFFEVPMGNYRGPKQAPVVEITQDNLNRNHAENGYTMSQIVGSHGPVGKFIQYLISTGQLDRNYRSD